MERIHILIQQERIIEECVDELIELIDNSRTPAFGGEDRRVVETGAVTEKFNILKEIAAASGNDKLLVEAKKAEDAIFCSPAPKFGSADFKTMQLPCRKNVLAFCRKIMCGAIAGDYEHRYNKKLFERIKHHGTSR